MFVPRALLKKGVRPPAKNAAKPPVAAPEHAGEPQKLLPTRPATGAKTTEQTTSELAIEGNLPLHGKRKLDQTSPAEETAAVLKKAKGEQQPGRGSNITKAEVSDGYLEQVVLGVEIFFSDYAHRDKESSLNRLRKVIDGEEGYVHISAMVISPLLENMKPPVTQHIIHRALEAFPSEYIEVAPDGFHVRRKPSTYPLPFLLAEEAVAALEEDGESFWDDKTIYVEPDRSTMCLRPTSVASTLKKNGELAPKLLPIQAVQSLHPTCALVVFSGSITHNSGKRWLEQGLPKDWIIMSKDEHDRRTEEYEALLTGDERRRGSSSNPSGPLNKRQELRLSKRRQAEKRAARLLESEKTAPVIQAPESLASGSTAVAFPERWTFVRLSNMPQKLALEAIFRLVKSIAPRPIDSYLAFHTYGKLFVILQFAMKADAEMVVRAFNEKVNSLKEEGEAILEKWVNGLNQGYEHGSWDGLPDKTVIRNPSSVDRKKMQLKKEKAKRLGTYAKILGLEEAQYCWEQLQQNTGKTCTGAPPSSAA